MSNLVTRSIAGLIFSVIVLGSAYLGPMALGLLFLVFSAIGLYEFYDIYSKKAGNKPAVMPGLAGGALLYLLVLLYSSDVIEAKYFWLIALIVPVMMIMELVKPKQNVAGDVSATVFGWIYVILPFSMINMLPVVFGEFHYELPLGFFLILWINDTGAYFTGKYFGKRKLYPAVSPNKTWEGLIGGIVLSFVVGFILSTMFDIIGLRDWLVVSFIVAVFANLGDLFESLIKRNFDIKDSGSIIPGHGGVLDRFDGLFLSLPVLMFYFKFVLEL